MPDSVRQRLIFAHQEWMGFVQPVGLVVAPTVLVDAQVLPDRNIAGRQRDFCGFLEQLGSGATARRRVRNLRQLFVGWLGWEEDDLVDANAHREELEISLLDLQAVLSATWAVPSADGSDDQWMMLIRAEESGADLDRPPDGEDAWNASRHARFERLLRETGIRIGLLCNDERIRLIYAPPGESSGHVTYDFSQMAMPAGRPILAAFEMLLSSPALFMGQENARLPALLEKSREAQAEVSTRLSRQVLAALYELLRGFVAADSRRGSRELMDLAYQQPDHLYGGLITALMRLVFVLYTEDRGLMSDHPVYQQHYSLGGLFARLRDNAAAWPDTMDQRFGAWAQLLSLFRLIHGGGGHAGLSFVARKGSLFDPERFPFLEGRASVGDPEIPMVPDATIWKVLQNLMVLDGERLSYRTLDVEQIGSVYEAIMGFRVELTTGHSIAVRSQKQTGAAVVVDLDRLLEADGGQRVKALQDATDRRLTGHAASALRNAMEPAEIVAALDSKVDRDATPDILPPHVPVLQPTDERRRSGSHYTPRSLTEPIVSEALRPILERLGATPRPEAILDLKILDPATGSGAFLVEACRQLAECLVESWSVHGEPLDMPVDDDPLVHARRLIAQRCLYGVDKNPMAIDLARLSLWLATFAKGHEFTFTDHALRHGDSLVGLTQQQIEGFHWKANVPKFQMGVETIQVRERVKRVSALRKLIREVAVNAPEQELRGLWKDVQQEVKSLGQFGDLLLAAFFEENTGKARERKRLEYADMVVRDRRYNARGSYEALGPPLVPFHWEVEFPEVFDRENPGFDAIVGNPPFAGHTTIVHASIRGYTSWLRMLHPQSSGKCDVIAHFFRRAFYLLRENGAFGLIATNTIAQGDTRSSGLRWICSSGGMVYNAHRRIKWPGQAAVVVSVVHVFKGAYTGPAKLDRRKVDKISAFLFHQGGNEDPKKLAVNSGKSFQGSIILGMGFTFDDKDAKGVATPLSKMYQLIEKDPRNKDVLFPYIGGQEMNTSPTHAHHRHVINFGALEEDECWRHWPELMMIVEDNVKPARKESSRKSKSSHGSRAEVWWQHYHSARNMYTAIKSLDQVLVINCGATPHHAFTFLPAKMVFANTLAVFPFETYAAFCALQARPHEVWTRFFGSSMKDDLRYTPSDCFETFPFPVGWETHSSLEAAGKEYYEFRAEQMVQSNEGLTKIYNRFHDPEERSPQIAALRKLHSAMDRAVLDAYGWVDIATDCEFLLDYEIDEGEWGKKKKPYRYRWADDVRDEVLARLMALNAERALVERLAGDKTQLKGSTL